MASTSARPAADAREAVQWTYFGYLGAIKEANGAAMSIGRISTFLDIYIERDLREGTLDEAGAQELIDQLVVKLRIVRFLRTPGLRRAVLRRPLLGDRMHRRHGPRRPHAGDAHQLPHAAHAHQSRPRARAQHDGALVEAACPTPSSATASGCRPRRRRSSTRTTISCGPNGATTTASPAASRPCASASRCSSSAPA